MRKVRITIEQIPQEREEELRILCHDPTALWVTVAARAAAPEDTVTGWRDGTAYRLPLKEICYFETVDGRGFLYGESEVWECRMRLYEFEEAARHAGFFRCGKSMVLNAEKIACVVPSLSGRFTATLVNGEQVVVSRQYVADLKERMGI